MARLIIILALVAGFIILYRSLFGGTSPSRDDSTETADMAQDPTCGTYVPKKQSITKSVHGKEYFFCSKKCADEYSSKKE